jgi:hypothetical protein
MSLGQFLSPASNVAPQSGGLLAPELPAGECGYVPIEPDPTIRAIAQDVGPRSRGA